MKIRDIVAPIEEFAPLSLQESYDNSGLVVGRLDDELQGGVLLAVDVTEEVIAEAIEKSCGLIITHHPIIFHPLKRFNSASVVERCVELAIKNNIALYACHTNLDSTQNGMSWRVGEMLGLQNMEILQPTSEGAGFGVVGILPSATDEESFLHKVKQTFSVEALRHSALLGREVKRVAICTGAGASLMGEAKASGCDIYLTADLKYNDFYTPDSHFVVVDMGHFESEFCAIAILFDILSKIFINFALHKSAQSKNPVRYFV
ncbi:MAG: Nif3-like dinuclear metal center hexameric protein [Alistipes sp.]|nr:Nif3-like dinuclear metal center hexameric protein [Alistipes sp.]